MQKIQFILCATILFMCSCKNSTPKQNAKHTTVKTIKRPEIKYSLLSGKDTIKQTLASLNSDQKKLLCAINRVDSSNLALLDTLLIPDKFDGSVEQYLPFPGNIRSLDYVNKIILFSYPMQAFAAYEDGNLVYTGQTNMGRKADQTPTGLFFTNWKAEKTTSTFNDEWDLKWNFNIENKLGVGFHEYALPGYPASHSCLRLTETDAKYLYNWADQWVLKGTDDILAKGTPVIVFGTYPFGGSKPWHQLATNNYNVEINPDTLKMLVTPYLPEINEAQEKRSALK